MTRLLVALVAFSLVVLACGSGGDDPQPGGTATSERAERSASVSEQEAQADVAVADEEAEEDSDVAEQVAAQAEAQEEDSDAQVVELPVDVVGVHKGVRSQRNVLGDPDAAVEIMYFGDFT